MKIFQLSVISMICVLFISDMAHGLRPVYGGKINTRNRARTVRVSRPAAKKPAAKTVAKPAAKTAAKKPAAKTVVTSCQQKINQTQKEVALLNKKILDTVNSLLSHPAALTINELNNAFAQCEKLDLQIKVSYKKLFAALLQDGCSDELDSVRSSEGDMLHAVDEQIQRLQKQLNIRMTRAVPAADNSQNVSVQTVDTSVGPDGAESNDDNPTNVSPIRGASREASAPFDVLSQQAVPPYLYGGQTSGGQTSQPIVAPSSQNSLQSRGSQQAWERGHLKSTPLLVNKPEPQALHRLNYDIVYSSFRDGTGSSGQEGLNLVPSASGGHRDRTLGSSAENWVTPVNEPIPSATVSFNRPPLAPKKLPFAVGSSLNVVATQTDMPQQVNSATQTAQAQAADVKSQWESVLPVLGDIPVWSSQVDQKNPENSLSTVFGPYGELLLNRLSGSQLARNDNRHIFLINCLKLNTFIMRDLKTKSQSLSGAASPDPEAQERLLQQVGQAVAKIRGVIPAEGISNVVQAMCTFALDIAGYLYDKYSVQKSESSVDEKPITVEKLLRESPVSSLHEDHDAGYGFAGSGRTLLVEQTGSVPVGLLDETDDAQPPRNAPEPVRLFTQPTGSPPSSVENAVVHHQAGAAQPPVHFGNSVQPPTSPSVLNQPLILYELPKDLDQSQTPPTTSPAALAVQPQRPAASSGLPNSAQAFSLAPRAGDRDQAAVAQQQKLQAREIMARNVIKAGEEFAVGSLKIKKRAAGRAVLKRAKGPASLPTPRALPSPQAPQSGIAKQVAQSRQEIDDVLARLQASSQAKLLPSSQGSAPQSQAVPLPVSLESSADFFGWAKEVAPKSSTASAQQQLIEAEKVSRQKIERDQEVGKNAITDNKVGDAAVIDYAKSELQRDESQPQSPAAVAAVSVPTTAKKSLRKRQQDGEASIPLTDPTHVRIGSPSVSAPNGVSQVLSSLQLQCEKLLASVKVPDPNGFQGSNLKTRRSMIVSYNEALEAAIKSTLVESDVKQKLILVKKFARACITLNRYFLDKSEKWPSLKAVLSDSSAYNNLVLALNKATKSMDKSLMQCPKIQSMIAIENEINVVMQHWLSIK